MIEFMEYFYCLIYVSSLTFCVYKYLDRKPSKIELIAFLVFYGLIDYLMTGSVQIEMKNKVFINILTIISDYLCICLLNRKIKLYLFFYSILYFTLYCQIIVVVTYLLMYFEKFSLFMALEPSLLRFTLVFIFNINTIMLFKELEINNILPKVNIIKIGYKLFCVITLLNLFVMTVFQWMSQYNQVNIYLHIISIIFVILWLVLIYTLNKSFVLSEDKENQIIMKSIYSNIEQYMHQYEREEEQLKMIRHDMKNHFMIIKNINQDKYINQYIDELYPKLDEIKIKTKKISGNIYIDTILNEKISEYPNITIKYHCNIEKININSLDLSVILFNLIDNACQAANEINGNVTVNIKNDEKHLFIGIKNSYKETPNFISRKGVGHGYGMKIIDNIVEKYHGNIEYEVLEKEVYVKVGLII